MCITPIKLNLLGFLGVKPFECGLLDCVIKRSASDIVLERVTLHRFSLMSYVGMKTLGLWSHHLIIWLGSKDNELIVVKKSINTHNELYLRKVALCDFNMV